MPEPPYSRESSVRKERADAGVGKCCAYNQTRERFLCAEIEAGDFNPSGLETRLRSLAPGFGAALWIVPFRGISPTSVRVPIDLVYLDANSVVLDVVESFPISMPLASGPAAASVLALPANTLGSAETRVGDRLILCSPEEMKLRLAHMVSAKPPAGDVNGEAADQDQAIRGAGARVLKWVDRSRTKTAGEAAPVEVPEVVMPAMPEAAPEPAASQPEPATKKPAKGWLHRLLSPEPPEPRQAQRECLQGLAAYFFTGGDAVAHAVRDVSATGLYVFTDERWYPGTVVRMTLTDRRRPSAERSVTVHASVVRWGNDGVGLEFVLPDGKNQRRGTGQTSLAGGASKAQLGEFLARMKSDKKK